MNHSLKSGKQFTALSFLTLLLWFASGVFTVSLSASEDSPEVIDKILCVNDYETVKERIDACSRSLEREPKSDRFWFYRGYHRFATKQYQLAIDDFNQAIAISPTIDSDYYHYRGMAHEKLQQYQQALSDFNQALDIDPELGESYYNRGRIYYFLDQLDHAYADFKAAIDHGLQTRESYEFLSIAMLKKIYLNRPRIFWGNFMKNFLTLTNIWIYGPGV